MMTIDVQCSPFERACVDSVGRNNVHGNIRRSASRSLASVLPFLAADDHCGASELNTSVLGPCSTMLHLGLN